jgi:hypothetical protein
MVFLPLENRCRGLFMIARDTYGWHVSGTA